jgi:hypothetical protein
MKLRISEFRRSFEFKFNKIELLLMALIVLGSFLIPVFINAKNEEIEITEIMYRPESKKAEWIEIYNPTSESFLIDERWGIIDEIDLVEGDDGYKKCHEFSGEIEIKSESYVIVTDDKEQFLNDYDEFDSSEIIEVSSLSLRDSDDDGVWISDDGCESFLIDVNYDPKDDEKVEKGYSLEDEDGEWRGSYVLGGTPGEKNSQKEDIWECSDEIRINEILPNPSGDEKRGEYIELYNFSDQDLNLLGWSLRDSSKSGEFTFEESVIIEKDAFLIIYRDEFDFALNNSGGESVFLIDPNGETVFEVSYEKAKENLSLGFDSESESWRWSKYLTPKKKNKFSTLPVFEVEIDDKVFVNSSAEFLVDFGSGENDDLSVTWDFGDGRKSYKKETSHKYQKSGKYEVTLKIFTGSEEIERVFGIEVENFPEIEVEIVAIMPNPEGKDSEKEWIEIKNKEKKKINLRGWSIATGTSKEKLTNHPIENDFVIKSKKSRKITRKQSKFSLPNKKGRIEIRYPDGSVAVKLKYKKEGGIGDDEVYEKQKKKWVWIEAEGNKQELENNEKKSESSGQEVSSSEGGEQELEINNQKVESDSEIDLDDGKKESVNKNSEEEKIFVTIETENGKNKTFVVGLSGAKRGDDIKKTQKHYLRVFLERLNAKINMFLNKKVA